jgi:hypothetical protein
MRKAFLIGTNHRYQILGELARVTSSQWDEFIEMLRNVISRNGIRGIAEEMSKESLRKKHFCRVESFACQLAEELGIAHRYCDPDTATRAALSITDFERRERYWLEQLQSFDGFPAVFILGSEHFESFENLLKHSGFETVEVVRDWVPSDYVPDDELEQRFFEQATNHPGHKRES